MTPDASVAARTRGWVAIVDDDDSLRRSLVRLLRSVDIDAQGFASAEDYLARAGAATPACAVVDVYLGAGLNGYELKERLDREGHAVPMVFMTALSELPIRMSDDRAAVASCLRKPFTTEDLLARLLPLLDATVPPRGDQ